jgi:hypothetical protein
MSILKINKRKDFGTEYYVQLLNIKRTSLLQVSFSLNDYCHRGLISNFVLELVMSCSIVFWAGKLGIDITLLGRTWSWDFMKEIDEEEDVQQTIEGN